MTENTTKRSGKTSGSLFMRAAMLLIVLLAASLKCLADSNKIKYFLIPDKKARKACLESGKWYEYKTTIEYYVNDQYPNAEAFARVNKLVVPNTRTDRTPCVKKTSECIVKIAPYKKEPELWNIFFDGIGVAISTNGMKFKD